MSTVFDNNWRRALLLTKQSAHDVEMPTEYVALDDRKLPKVSKKKTDNGINKFCARNAFEYGFDYDPFSFLVWPIQDNVTASALAASLNETFPGVARVIKKTPVEAHGLTFSNEREELEPIDDLTLDANLEEEN